MDIRPLHNNVVIEKLPLQQQIRSSLILMPKEDKERIYYGRIVAIGPGIYDKGFFKEILNLKIGDFVIFGKHSANEFNFNGKDYFVVKDNDVVAVTDTAKVSMPHPI